MIITDLVDLELALAFAIRGRRDRGSAQAPDKDRQATQRAAREALRKAGVT
jgi:hypothetical protein